MPQDTSEPSETERLAEAQTSGRTELYNRVESFIQKVHDLDYEFTENAHNTILSGPNEKQGVSISDRITVFMEKYETAKADYLSALKITTVDHLTEIPIDVKEERRALKDESIRVTAELRFQAAKACLVLIDRAFAWGAVREGAGLARKLREAQTQVSTQKLEIEELSTRYVLLQGRYEECQKNLHIHQIEKDPH